MSDGPAMTQMTRIALAGSQRLGATDLIAVLGMLLVATAIGVGFHLQLRLPAAVAAVLALAAQIALLAVHQLVRRAGALKNEVVRLQAELDGLTGRSASETTSSAASKAVRGTAPAKSEPSSDKARMDDPAAKGAAPPSALPLALEPRSRPALPEGMGTAAPAASAGLVGPGEGLQELWSFRPTSPPQLPTGPAPDPAAPALVAPREADVELIQGLIKKLAEEVNASEPPSAAQRPNAPARSPETTEAAIEVSLEALRTAAETMRSARPPARELAAAPGSSKSAAPLTPPEKALESPARKPHPESPVANAAAAPSSAPAVQARIAALTDAVTAGRVDVLLEPILGLEDQRARHFEVSVRLRGTSGETLEADRGESELRGTGLLPLLDCASLARTAQVARRLADRGRQGAVLSQLSAEALGHDAFLNEFAEAVRAHDRFADQLVLAFSQRDVRGLAKHEWETLADMRDLGFRFALQALTDLDMDFEALAKKGFSFVKLDADVFLEGMPAPGGLIPAADICRHLAQLGLTLIVGGIDDETKLARIFGFGVVLGQGQMFGGPRPVKAEALGPHPAAA